MNFIYYFITIKMGQRVYVLSLNNKLNVVGIYTNIRQVYKIVQILNLPSLDNLFLQEIRMNENPLKNVGKECKYMLVKKQSEMEIHKQH